MTITIVAAVLLHVAANGQQITDDPYIWLEDVSSPKAMEWVEAHSASSLKRLEADSRYATLYNEALAIAGARDRIPAALPERHDS